MTKKPSSPNSRAPAKRRYRMDRRARQADETRLRITEAAMRLHTSVGPSQASLVAIAEAAGVTRPTLYRHFSSAEELFTACMDHWQVLNPPPDPGPWLAITDLDERIHRAVSDVYRWYAAHGAALYPIYRDSAATPESNRQARQAIGGRIADVVLSGMPLPAASGRTMRVALAHVMGFWTWRSLTIDAGLSWEEAAALATRFALSALAEQSRPLRRLRTSRRAPRPDA